MNYKGSIDFWKEKCNSCFATFAQQSVRETPRKHSEGPRYSFANQTLAKSASFGRSGNFVAVGLYFMGCPVHSVPAQPHKTEPCSDGHQKTSARKSPPYNDRSGQRPRFRLHRQLTLDGSGSQGHYPSCKKK